MSQVEQITCLSAELPLALAGSLGREACAGLEAGYQSEMGQFLTPPAVAGLLAGMFDSAERLGPVVAAFAVELAGSALEQADMAGDVSRRRTGRELHSLGGSFGKPALSFVVQEGKDDVSCVLGFARESAKHFPNAGFSDALELACRPDSGLLAQS